MSDFTDKISDNMIAGTLSDSWYRSAYRVFISNILIFGLQRKIPGIQSKKLLRAFFGLARFCSLNSVPSGFGAQFLVLQTVQNRRFQKWLCVWCGVPGFIIILLLKNASSAAHLHTSATSTVLPGSYHAVRAKVASDPF